MSVRRPFAALTAMVLAVPMLLAGCSSGTAYAPAPVVPTAPPGPTPVGRYIKHVVVIVQENRSFENLFAGWPGADAPLTGYALVNGQRVAVPLRSLTYAENHDICHIWRDAMVAWNHGKMDGFNLEHQGTGPDCTNAAIGDYPYHYMDHAQIAPYRTLASRYVLADHMFPTEFGTSFTAHQDLIAGTTRIAPGRSLVNVPTDKIWGCDAYPGTATYLLTNDRHVISPPSGPFPCLTQYPTIADTLAAAGVAWKYYAPPLHTTIAGGIWTAFDAIAKVRCAHYSAASQKCSGQGAAWRNVVTPETEALRDFARGDVPPVSWVIPDLPYADYPVETTDYGPSWVGDLVNAIGHSKDWSSTAIVILWDDWGGWYDNVPPPQLDYEGLAIRVPCIIVSPYAKKNYVSTTQYEYGSILKFIEQAFNLGSLHSTDARSNSLVDSFDFMQKPRAFVSVRTKYPPSFFLNMPQSMRPPDDY